MPQSWQSVPASIDQPKQTPHNNTEQSEESKQQQQLQHQRQQKQRRNQSIQSHMSKRTSNVAHMSDDDDIDVESFVDRNFNDYSDSAIDHTDDDMSQSPIAKGLPTKFMFRGMRGQRQYDVPQIGSYHTY